MDNEIQKTEAPLMGIIAAATADGGVDADKLMKLLEAHEKWEANEARKAFAAAFTVTQASIEAVVRTAVNPQTKSKYAKLEGVIEMAKPVYTEHGFSVIFYEGATEAADNVRVCADVLHGEGHKETYHYDVPLGGVGIKGVVNMTKIHGKATSVTYGRRYLMCMIWNIPTQDDDGAGAGDDGSPPERTPDEAAVLEEIYCQLFDTAGQNGVALNKSRLGKMLFGLKGHHQNDLDKVGTVVAYLINRLTENNSWHIVGDRTGQ